MNTPEKITQSVETAGVFRRLAALVYDSFLIGAIWFAISGIGVSLNGGEAPPSWANHYLLFPSLIIATFLFYFWFWTHGGQTLGMRAWRLRILSTETNTLTFSQCLKRFFFSVVLIGAGFFYCFFNKDKLSLHDLLSNTRVVLMPKEVH